MGDRLRRLPLLLALRQPAILSLFSAHHRHLQVADIHLLSGGALHVSPRLEGERDEPGFEYELRREEAEALRQIIDKVERAPVPYRHMKR